MKKYLILLLLFACGYSLFAQFDLQLHYDSPSPEAEKIIQKTKLKKEYKSLIAIEKDLQKLTNRFHREHYTAFSIDTLINDASIYKAYLYIGNPLTIQHIEVEGLQEVFKEEIKKTSSPFSMQDVFAYASDVLTFLENKGYPFAKVECKDIIPDSNGNKALIQVEENNYIAWDSIIVKGNAKLSKSFLYGFFNIKFGKAYEETTAKQIPDLIQELPYVEETQPASISFGKDKAALYLYLNKRNTNQFDGFLGIVPVNDKSGKTLITGNINLLLNNIMTLGERISLQWKNPDKLSQNLAIELTFPYLFRSRFGLDLDFYLQKKDTTYLHINFSPALQYYFKGSNYLAFYYRYNNARLIATRHLQYAVSLPDQIDFDLHLYGLEFFYRKVDYVFNPRKGFILSATAAIGKRTIIENTHIPAGLYDSTDMQSMQVESKVDASLYVPIRKRWTCLLRLQGGYVYNSELFENELFRIGGLKTLRGFIEQSIYASAYAILNTELRFIFHKNSFVHAFFDAGWYEKKSTGGYINDIPFGFGLGLAFDTRAGMFSMNYALGKQFDNPISFKTGVVSFGYIALF